MTHLILLSVIVHIVHVSHMVSISGLCLPQRPAVCMLGISVSFKQLLGLFSILVPCAELVCVFVTLCIKLGFILSECAKMSQLHGEQTAAT